MPPPPSYIDITTLPFSRVVTQAEFNGGTFGGVANEVWFRRVAPTIEAFGNFTDKGGTFTPRTTLYESDGTTVIKTISGVGGSHAWFHIFQVDTYYMKVTRQGGGASNFDFTAAFENDLNVDTLVFQDGDVIIQDQRQDYPAMIYGLDGTLRGFVTTIPAGQTGAIIPSAKSMWHDLAGTYSPPGWLHLFNADLTYAGAIDASLESGQAAPMSNSATDFYVVNQRTPRDLSKLDATGAITALGNIGSGTQQVAAIGVNAAGTILYWTQETGAGSDSIHAYDLVNQIALADLYTIAGFSIGNDNIARTDNLNPGELIVLPDGSVVTWWYDASADQYTLLHISSSGVLINDFPLTATTQRMDHLAYIRDSVTETLIYLFINEFDSEATVGILTLATGAISGFDTPTFDFGISNLADDPTIFGPSISCEFVQLHTGPAPPECPGLASQPRIDGLPYVPPEL